MRAKHSECFIQKAPTADKEFLCQQTDGLGKPAPNGGPDQDDRHADQRGDQPSLQLHLAHLSPRQSERRSQLKPQPALVTTGPGVSDQSGLVPHQ